MISERIFNNEFSIDQIINMLLDERIDFIFQKLYSDPKVNTAASSNEQEDVA